MIYILCLVLFCVGIYGVLRKRNLIKMIVGLCIAEFAMNLFFILVAYRRNGRAPILSPEVAITSRAANDWEPAAAFDSSGAVWVAYDSYQNADYDVFLTKVSDGRPGPVTGRLREAYWAAHEDPSYTTPVDYREAATGEAGFFITN